MPKPEAEPAPAGGSPAPAMEWCDVCRMTHGIELQPCYDPDPDGDFAR